MCVTCRSSPSLNICQKRVIGKHLMDQLVYLLLRYCELSSPTKMGNKHLERENDFTYRKGRDVGMSWSALACYSAQGKGSESIPFSCCVANCAPQDGASKAKAPMNIIFTMCCVNLEVLLIEPAPQI